jgi:hypothetical protein
MCDKICNTCGEQQCEKICLCQKAPYKETVCETIQDFKCVVLEKKEDGQNNVFPCLGLESGDSLLDLTEKVEELKCGLSNQNFFDEKTKTTASDSTAGFLADKIIPNDCITWVTENIAGNIKLKPVLNFSCIFDKIKVLPGFCAVINACKTDCIPPATVTLLADEGGNVCPSNTLNLNSFIDTIPAGTVVEWHKNTTHTSLITNPTTYSFTSTNTVYVFTKDILTGCYSAPVAVLAIKHSCTPAPIVNLNCGITPTILSGVFEKTVVSNGVIRIPVSVTANSGIINVTVSGAGFTNNGAFAQNVTTSTVNLDIPVTYDGTGNIGNHIITVTITGASVSPITCNYPIAVVCKPCLITNTDVVISNVGSAGFTISVNNLENIASCKDHYYLGIIDTLTGNQIITLNNLMAPYNFTIGMPDTDYTIEVVKYCCCGNFDGKIIKNQVTNQCVPTSFIATPSFPNAQAGIPYNYSIQLGGTQPFTQRPTVNRRPIWMTEVTVGDAVTFGGTPPLGLVNTKFQVNVAYDNCNEVMPASYSQSNISIL